MQICQKNKKGKEKKEANISISFPCFLGSQTEKEGKKKVEDPDLGVWRVEAQKGL
jgi:hypothetical protein